MDKKYLALLLAVAVVAGGAGYLLSHPLTLPIEGIACEAMEPTGFHIHVHLELWKNGAPVPIRAGIGVVGGCFYWLHTHTPDGIIHVEAPEDRKFTLGQFYAIWGASAPRPDDRATVQVDHDDGKGFQIYEGDWRNLALTSHELISIGSASPPAGYAFPEGL